VIGTTVVAEDGTCGILRRVVLNPIANEVSHFVVETRHAHGIGHLVPTSLVGAVDEAVHLRCTISQFEKLPFADEGHFTTGSTGTWAYGPGQMVSLPYFERDMGSLSAPSGDGVQSAAAAVVHDGSTVLAVELLRGDIVHATDGRIGKVHGVLIDPATHQATHLLLEGVHHLWGRKEIAVPISAVTSAGDGLHLDLTRDQVRELPEVPIKDR
jgi:sporulation protein YlmC with PRC-barrel domain